MWYTIGNVLPLHCCLLRSISFAYWMDKSQGGSVYFFNSRQTVAASEQIAEINLTLPDWRRQLVIWGCRRNSGDPWRAIGRQAGNRVYPVHICLKHGPCNTWPTRRLPLTSNATPFHYPTHTYAEINLRKHWLLYDPRMQRGNAFGHVSVCVCVFLCCAVRALNFESFELETSLYGSQAHLQST